VKWDVWGLALLLYGFRPLGAFMLARRSAGRATPILAAGVGLLLALGVWGSVQGNALGAFDGFVPFFLGLAALLTAHLGAAGLVAGWLSRRPGWADRPALVRHGAPAGLIGLGYASVLLWPQID
jgi:uncharacterized membrane protein YhhN